MTRSEAASKGGQAVFKKYGPDYMRKIGRNGALAFWAKYTLEPVQLTRYAIVNKLTREIVNYMDGRGLK